jgi:hypothetical protein
MALPIALLLLLMEEEPRPARCRTKSTYILRMTRPSSALWRVRVSVSVCQCVSVSVCQCVSVSVCQCVEVVHSYILQCCFVNRHTCSELRWRAACIEARASCFFVILPFFFSAASMSL